LKLLRKQYPEFFKDLWQQAEDLIYKHFPNNEKSEFNKGKMPDI